MKNKNVPKHLEHVPDGYQFDVGDKKAVKKYREEKHTKLRKKKVTNEL